MKRASLAALAVPALVGVAVAAPPEAPAELGLEVYSASTLELFWGRSTDDGRVVGYEIRRNGETVPVGDVTSYLDDAIESESSVTYSVVAVDDEGERSPPGPTLTYRPDGAESSSSSSSSSSTSSSDSSSSSSSSSSSGSRSWCLYVTADDHRSRPTWMCTSSASESSGATASAPSAPRELRAEVYSSSALELFWEAPLDAGVGASYEVARDGAALSSTTGTSLYEDGLQAGRRYRYSVRTVEADGRRSADSADVAVRTASR